MSTHHSTDTESIEPRPPGTTKARWHPQHAACQGCGRTDRTHIARGFCENCYRKARAAERRHAEAHGAPIAAPARRSGWHFEYAACVACGGTTRPHLSDGLCVDCYRARRVPGDRGHEDLPLYQPESALSPVQTAAPTPPLTPASLRAGISRHSGADSADTRSLESMFSVVDGAAEHHPLGLSCPSAPSGADGDREVVGVLLTSPVNTINRPSAPRLFARHIKLIRLHSITCPNCGEVVRNNRTGGDTFQESELPPGTEIACGCCGAWWGISLE